MKKLNLIIFLMISFMPFAQKTEFGLTLEGSLPLLSNKEEVILKLNQDSYLPSPPHLVIPSSFWNVEHLTFDVYPKPLPNTSFSVGIRMFNWGWEVDSVSEGYYSMGEWMTFYGRREFNRGYIFPTITVRHSLNLSTTLSIQPFASIGLFGIGSRYKKTSFANDADKQDLFDFYDFSSSDFGLDFDAFDFQIGTNIRFKYRGFFGTCGISYYHFRDTFYGKMIYHGFHLNTGIGYRFSSKVI